MKHAIARWLSALLILCLLCPAALAEDAQTEPEIIQTFTNSVRYLFVQDDVLYAQTFFGQIYRQVEGGWQLVASYPADLDVQNICTEGDKIWLLVYREGTSKSDACYQIVQGSLDGREIGEPMTLDLDIDDQGWIYMYGMVVDGDAAYVLAEHPEDRSRTRLYRVDMTNGHAEKITEEPLTELTSYKDGLLLARRHTWEETDENGDELPPQIVSIDPATGALTRIALMIDWRTAALTYDAAADAIYFCDSSHVYKAAGDTPEIVGYLLPSNMSRQNSSAIVHQGRYYVEDYSEVSSAPVDASLKPTHILRIEPFYELDDILREYAKLHPDVAIEYVDNHWSDLDDFTRLMQSDNAPALISLNMNNSFAILRDKKYLVDLSASGMLMDTVSAMYPHLTSELLMDGQLYGLPISLEVSCPGYFTGALEKAGLSEELMPSTYGELLDFIVTWHDDYFEENEGMEIVEYADDLRTSIFLWIYQAQQLACQNAGIPLTYNTPTIRSLLKRLDEITPIIDVVAPKMDDMDDYEFITNNALITEYDCYPLPRQFRLDTNTDAKPLILSLDEQTDPAIAAYMTVMAVNPYCGETDAAMELMEYVAKNLSQVFRTTMMPDCNDPIEVGDYERILEHWRRDAAALEKRVAEEPDDIDLAEQLDRYREVIADMEENGRWAMTTEEILWYREHIAPYLTLLTSKYSSSNASRQMFNIQLRYRDGQINADDFIREIESIVFIIQGENQ